MVQTHKLSTQYYWTKKMATTALALNYFLGQYLILRRSIEILAVFEFPAFILC
jgi:hypothetical protein